VSGQLPPFDAAAEDALLGAMLLSPGAAEIGNEILQASDFYGVGSQHIFAAVTGLWVEGSPHDPVAVADVLRRKGVLDAAGGPGKLIELQAGTPATSNAKRYAHIVLEMSQYRQLVAVHRAAADAAMSMVGTPGEQRDRFTEQLASMEAEIPSEIPSELSTLSEFLDRPVTEHAPWAVPGMLRRGWRVMVVAAEGVGKALDVDTPIPTPGGWTRMGEIRSGDIVFAGDGRPTSVVAVTPAMNDRPCFKVRFSDGEEIVADAEHRWATVDYAGRQRGRWDQVERTTAELARSVYARGGVVLNHVIERCPPLALPVVELPIDPYLLGVWLGDGTSRTGEVTNVDDAVIERIRSAGWQADSRDGLHWKIHRQADDDVRLESARVLVGSGVSTRAAERRVGVGRGALRADLGRVRQRTSSRASFASVLRGVGLLRNKHVPPAYLRASVGQREALLAGLLDADGSANRNRVELTLCDPVLAAGAIELIRSLGFRPSVRWSDATLYGRVVGRRCRIGFTPDRPVFGLSRKQEVLVGSCHRRSVDRYVASVEPVASVPVRCIQVANLDGIFLAGRSMVRTHNSVLLRQVAISASAGLHPFTHRPIPAVRTLVVDLENPDESIESVCAPMARRAGEVEGWDADRCWLWRRPAGIDLSRRLDRIELEQVLRVARPDLVCLGPVYKCYSATGKDDEETSTRKVQGVLDDLRIRYGFALLLEHHAPHGGGGVKRVMRPHGSVLWQRWPELGIGFEVMPEREDSFKLGRFRGDRLPNEWPERIDRDGGVWPWAGVFPTGTFDNTPPPRETPF